MSHDSRVAAALTLLEALTAAPAHRIPRDDARRLISCSDEELESYVALLSSLADREGGARAIVTCSKDAVALHGDAAALRPVRLSMGEGLALAHVIDALNIDRSVASRLSRALFRHPTGKASAEALIATTTSYGRWYQRLVEAIEDGVRCRISYRAHDEAEPAERIVDPRRIDTEAAASYLIAWNVEKDEERRYRLDRIARVALTEDSVAPHAWRANTIAASLRETGAVATVACPVERAAQLTWAGIISMRPAPDTPGAMLVDVAVASEHWLFDEVLSAAGELRIVSPATLIDAFVAYAEALRS